MLCTPAQNLGKDHANQIIMMITVLFLLKEMDLTKESKQELGP